MDGVETPLALLRLGAWQQRGDYRRRRESCAAVALAGPPRNLTHFEFVDALQTYFAGSRLAWADVASRMRARRDGGPWRTLAPHVGLRPRVLGAACLAGGVMDLRIRKAGRLTGAVHHPTRPAVPGEGLAAAVAMAAYWGPCPPWRPE